MRWIISSASETSDKTSTRESCGYESPRRRTGPIACYLGKQPASQADPCFLKARLFQSHSRLCHALTFYSGTLNIFVPTSSSACNESTETQWLSQKPAAASALTSAHRLCRLEGRFAFMIQIVLLNRNQKWMIMILFGVPCT